MFDNIFKGKRVFITGHTGFKGAWLSQWLLNLGAEVTGYALPPSYQNSLFDILQLKKHLKHIKGDVRDQRKLKKAIDKAKPDFIFHLAAQALVCEAYKNPVETFQTNLSGSVHLLEALRQYNDTVVAVFVTSDKCYRNVNWEWGYRENDVLGGRDPYSASKGCAENIFYSYYHSYLKEMDGVHIASARAGNVIGGGDWAKDRIVPDCVRALSIKQPIEIRNPHSTRPWQHVLEPLGAYLHLAYHLHHDPKAKRPASYNFGPNRSANKTVLEMVNKVIEVWQDGKVQINEDPNRVHEDILLQLNCDLADHYLNWHPIWDYDRSVTETTKWYRNQFDGNNAAEYTHQQINEYMKSWQEKL